MATIKPLQNRVLIQREESEQKTASGIIIPDTAQKKPDIGKVISVGPGKMLDNGTVIKPTVNTGDKVLFTSYAGDEVELNGEKYLVISEDHILGVIS